MIYFIITTISVLHFSERDMEKAKQTFMLSCAGYCVATYVLVSISVCVHEHMHLLCCYRVSVTDIMTTLW